MRPAAIDARKKEKDRRQGSAADQIRTGDRIRDRIRAACLPIKERAHRIRAPDETRTGDRIRGRRH